MEVRGVSLAYGAQRVLVDVDLQLRAGELVALVGPNGAGKSTLLSVLSGDVDPDQGVVEVTGRPLAEWSTIELALRRGVLLQQTEMSFPFTVDEVVRMGRTPWAGLDEEADDDRLVAESMVETDVAQFARRVFTSLSGGERSRAALARVLAQQPGVLLLDEPTAALDIRHQEQVLAIARQRAARGDAVAVVMHDLGLAAAHADRVVILSNGSVVADGTPAGVMTAAILSEVYECPIETFEHPRTGTLIIVPLREGSPCDG
jgi:iron complex transport system ATP-binding protein